MWAEGDSWVEKKVEWLEKKILGEERRGDKELESREEWLIKMTVEAACKRTRYVCKVPIYGGVWYLNMN